jgi:hypothetical protein
MMENTSSSNGKHFKLFQSTGVTLGSTSPSFSVEKKIANWESTQRNDKFKNLW